VVERAGDEQPSHQPEDGYSSEDSEGSTTVEEWVNGASQVVSPVDYELLDDDDDDPEVASSPVGKVHSAFVPIGGSALVADWMSGGFGGSFQSCGACATDWKMGQMDGFPRSHGLWDKGLTLVC